MKISWRFRRGVRSVAGGAILLRHAAGPIFLFAGMFIPSFAAGELKDDPPRWKVGAAAIDITPDGPVFTAGYGARITKPREKVLLPVFAKALALEDPRGGRLVIVTLDLIGVPRKMREAVGRKAWERYQLPLDALLLNASHTHTGPAFSGAGVTDPVFAAKAEAFGRELEEKIVGVIGAALDRRDSAHLHYTHARAGFAMNRRAPLGLSTGNSPYPDGPVDHDVPVLRVTNAEGKLRAVMFGYACHNTATGGYLVLSGDYAGHAQKYLEDAHPSVVALFVMGAGGDQNPYPRHSASLEQPAQHGRTLANAVEAALSVVKQRPVRPPLRTALGDVPLDFSEISRIDFERKARSQDKQEKASAERLLADLERGAPIPASYPCPVQVVRLGTDLVLAAIGGEITVDYSLRLKSEWAGKGPALWVAGYSNDVFGYLGSKRVIIEGGYEGYSANLGRFPGPWALDSEDRVIRKVYELLQIASR